MVPRRAGHISPWTLTASVVVGLATAGLLAYAGRITQQRPVLREQRRVSWSFAAWWYGASLVILNQTLRTILAILGVRDMDVYLALAYFGNVPLAAALGGLLFYILYLLTGRRNLLPPIVALYASYFVYLTWYTQRAGPRELVIGDWQAQLAGANPPAPSEALAFGLLLAVPLFITVAAYAILAFRVPGATQRYRLGLISVGFLLLFGMILLGYLLRWNEEPWFSLAYQFPALVASMLVVLAYRPPVWVQRRFHVEPVPAHAPHQGAVESPTSR